MQLVASIQLNLSKNVTFRDEDATTIAMVSPLRLTILYKAGYYSRSMAFPSHLHSQHRICSPSFIENDLKQKNISSWPLDQPRTRKSPGFQYTCDIVFETIYFLWRRVCQTPTLLISLNNHLTRRTVFFA
jgi:hypothetical protein